MPNYRNNSMPYGNCYARNVAPMSNMDRCATQAPEIIPSCKDDMVLAMAYVKWQTWQKLYDVEKALQYGTIFQELNLPFCGVGGCQK